LLLLLCTSERLLQKLLLWCTCETLLQQWHNIQTTSPTAARKMAAWRMASSCPATHDMQDPEVNPCRSCSPCCGICYGSPAPAVLITLPMVRQEQTSNRDVANFWRFCKIHNQLIASG
jgi:hypothetical protein